MNEETIILAGTSTSKVPGLQHIPYSALRALAARFEMGEIKHGAMYNYRKGLGSREYAIERLGHVINHAYELIEEIQSGRFSGEDHAAAIMWGGTIMTELVEGLRQ